MLFDVEEPGAKSETEISPGLESLVSFAPAGGWFVNGSLRYQVVMTHERMRFWFLTVGASRAFATPEWLRGVLR